MEDIIEFFLKAGEVKRLKQRGLVLRGIKDPVTVGAHSFRTALMAWILAKTGNSGLNPDRVIKTVLVHDIIAGYAGDITPYEPLIWKNDETDLKKMYEKWVRLPKEEKERFHAEQRSVERKTLEKLIILLPTNLATEMKELWIDYEEGKTKEGRFVQQVDMLENFLQALEYWKEDKTFPIEAWWHEAKQLISDQTLIEFLHKIDDVFYREKGHR